MSRPSIHSLSSEGKVTAGVIVLLVALPLLIPDYWTTNIFVRAMAYGIVTLSLTFLAHYGGFISMAQLVIAGVAGYVVAATVPGTVPAAKFQWSYAEAIAIGILGSTLAGLLVGAVAVRTREIYLLMITLAIAVGFYFAVQTNIEYLNGYEGIRNVLGPDVFGLPFRNTYVFYYVALLSALLLYGLVLYVGRTPFGLVLQGIRDNVRRVSALGYHVAWHRIAAFGIAGFIAGCGGVLTTFYNIGISPGSVAEGVTVSVLIMAVIGGLGHPVGAFIGALIFALVDTFAASIYDRDRFNTLIGVVFLLIVLVSPDGMVGIARRLSEKLRSPVKRDSAISRQPRGERTADPATQTS